MPYLPDIYTGNGQTLTTATFYGLNRGLVVADGEMADMTNLVSDHFPVLATRPRRRVPSFPGVEGGGHVNPVSPQGLLGTDRLIMADDGHIHVDGVLFEGVTLSTEAEMQPKRMVAMGAYRWARMKLARVNLALGVRAKTGRPSSMWVICSPEK